MTEVARASTRRGEIVLRQRDDETLELRVNGVFVMDTRESSSERLLAHAALDATTGTSLKVLIGGLGLGFTLREVLSDVRVSHVTVAEIEQSLVEWHRSGLIPFAVVDETLLDDPRVVVAVGDVRAVVRARPGGSLDIVLLDVDNGPGFLVYDDNADIYQESFLTACSAALRADGIIAIWSAEASPALTAVLRQIFRTVQCRPVPVILGRRATTYYLFIGRHAA